MNTDPTGHCIFAGVDTVLCAAIGGGIAGGVIGGAYAKWMYHLAYTGKCGCEGQQLISQYTEAQFVWKGIGMGAIFGVAFGALGAASIGGIAGSGAVLASLAGVGLSGYGIATSVQRIQADPNNECAWWDLGLSLFGVAASAYALSNAANNIALPGGAPMGGLNITKFRTHLLGAIDEFINEASSKHPVHGFGSTWRVWFKAASQDRSIANNLIVATRGDKIMGILRVQNGGREFPNALRLMDIEALSSESATTLIRAAAAESINRGFNGMYGFATTTEGASLSARTGGILMNPNNGLYYWDLSQP
jgi:hypothetical protein